MKICKVCGKPIESYREHSYDICFSCQFWQEKLEKDAKEPPHRVFVAHGTHYYIGDEDSKDYFRGFDGAKVTVTFNDGTVVKTSNLWTQGDIPPEFRNKFPDTATMVWHW